MKKFTFIGFVIIISILFISCGDDGSDYRSYQIFNNCPEISTYDPYLDGSLYEVIIYFYNDDKVQETHLYNWIQPGYITDVRAVPYGCKKAKISFKLVPIESNYYYKEENETLYTASESKLKKGPNVIEIRNETEVKHSLLSMPDQNLWDVKNFRIEKSLSFE